LVGEDPKERESGKTINETTKEGRVAVQERNFRRCRKELVSGGTSQKICIHNSGGYCKRDGLGDENREARGLSIFGLSEMEEEESGQKNIPHSS